MTPRAAESLLEAFGRTLVREDQLTELLACALQSDEMFRERILDVIFRDASVPPFEHVEVRTQVRLASRRVDMELLLWGSQGAHTVWIEVKAGAAEQTEQLIDYAIELQEIHRGRGTLVALGPTGDWQFWESADRVRRDGAPTVKQLTWQQVIQALDDVGGFRDGGVGWRGRARDSNATARQHFTLELYRHLHRERERLDIMPDEPLQVTDSLVVSRAEVVLAEGSLIHALLSLAAGQLAGTGVIRLSRATIGYWWGGGQGGFSVASENYKIPGWASELNAGGDPPTMVLWFQAGDETDRSAEPRHQPIFLASLVMNRPTARCRRALLDDRWELCGAFAAQPGNHGRISHIRYLADIATAGITLGSQAKALADWADASFRALSELAPPPNG